MNSIIYLNTTIFLFLAGVHFYWMAGGKWGMNAALPTTAQHQLIFNPGKIGTLVVALGLLAFAAITFAHNFHFEIDVPHYLRYGIAIIFLIRTIGDFQYVGIFRKIKHTVFARYDRKYYVPLCAYLAVSEFFLAAY
ncbi:DUF3995 domain-containing protein [Pedobacter ghigonis]|uniref:DUF3995 domain-containing protein n=1 Tax=Pedobacter ghigonis TaxID=2730403 RepID=UPI00158CF0D9|nr:DUF3995 domain-containing protein [Pedobacter ghigonis]